METELFLAKAWGLFLVLGSLPILFRPKIFRDLIEEFTPAFIYLSGLFSLIVGILSLLTYSNWSTDWKIIITVLGWMALLKGIIRMTFPNFVISKTRSLKDKRWPLILVALFIVLGVYLTCKGFIIS